MSRIKPGMPDAVVRAADEVYAVNGRLVRGLNITVSEDTMRQYLEGYRCFACHHAPQPEPFPERCVEPYCRFPMRRDQMRQLEVEFAGVEDLWPTRATDIWLPGD